MTTIDTGMVLAAGLGKRMRPLTDTLPKPMVPVAGRALIDRVIDRMIEADVRRVVANIHHHRATLETHLKTRRDVPVVTVHEPDLLETGGGVLNALPVLGPTPFYCANADVLWFDGPKPALRRLAEAWDDAKMDVLLLMQSAAFARGYDGRGDYFLDPAGKARRRRDPEIASFVFAGVQILHPRALAGFAPGAFSLNKVYDAAEAKGRLWGVVHDGLWFHVGTPDSIAATERDLGWTKPKA
ncbi:MAG: nucleotidyltransferase family protein [Tagaea sp.]|jgi:MurNAc alpha-1-phosphate uridylyltransferase|nr:nucleotidyltransferase family protein [Azospirillum sp.]MCA3268549.1 nucleotidyltransferase family protein [Azospirillum sp.]MCZ8122556.1 nucleotidyltransferase family protein [Magnetospirillum sp.]